jgi:hypothetical protein
MNVIASGVVVKRIFISLLLTLSMPAMAAQQPIVAATPVVVLMPTLLNNPDFFDFTAEQKRQISRIAQETNHIREALDQSIVDLRVELREELMKHRGNTQLIKQLIQDVNAQEAKRLSLSITCANGLRQILSATQWNALIELTH